jgi:hypothetical protein
MRPLNESFASVEEPASNPHTSAREYVYEKPTTMSLVARRVASASLPRTDRPVAVVERQVVADREITLAVDGAAVSFAVRGERLQRVRSTVRVFNNLSVAVVGEKHVAFGADALTGAS